MSGSKAKRDAIEAAMGVANDVAEGRLTPDQLDAELRAYVAAEFGVAIGPQDAVYWPLQVDLCRQVIALGGLSVDELLEWVAVRRQAQPAPAPVVEVAGVSGSSWIEQALEAMDDVGDDEPDLDS